ncbi:MAG: phage tail protein [Chloroflexi bacterium]|nr:phage tail protein [Chloroflexota bacterium]
MAKNTGRDSDPIPSFSFVLDFQGTISGAFSEVGGIGSENEVIEAKNVGQKGQEYIVKVPGRLKWTEITLKRGITDTMDMWEWRMSVEQGAMAKARKNCSITMYDRNFKPAARWDLVNAWPSKITGPSVKSDSNEFGVEEMVLQHEGMKRVSV